MQKICLDVKEQPIFIHGIKTKYKILSSGEVINTESDTRMRGGYDKNGYHIVSLTVNGKKYTRKVHRLVAIAFIPNPENLPEVDHKNCTKSDNDVSNLEWVTSIENTHRAMKNRLRPNSLSESDIHDICLLLEDGTIRMSEIARHYNVKPSMISKIKNRVIWVNISKDYDFNNYQFDRGRAGESNGNSKLNEKNVITICKLLEKGITPTEISNHLKISRKSVYDIKSRLTWKAVSSNFKF